MNCQFISIGEEWICTCCEFSTLNRRKYDQPPRRQCPDFHLNCRHRGEELRRVKDETCGCPNLTQPIFRCSIHGECSKRKYKTYGQTEMDCLHCKANELGFRVKTFPRVIQPACDVIAVTSLPPTVDVLDSLQSWQDAGLQVVAFNATEEIEGLKAKYGNYVSEWHSTQQDARWTWGRPYQTIAEMAKFATKVQQPVMLINADIEIHGDQSTLINHIARARAGVCTVGVRHNFQDWRQSELERWGLDAFFLSPAMADSLGPIFDSLFMGLPLWDYTLPKHLIQQGFTIKVDESPLFYHRRHDLRWNPEAWMRQTRLVQQSGYDFGVTWDMEFRACEEQVGKFREDLRNG